MTSQTTLRKNLNDFTSLISKHLATWEATHTLESIWSAYNDLNRLSTHVDSHTATRDYIATTCQSLLQDDKVPGFLRAQLYILEVDALSITRRVTLEMGEKVEKALVLHKEAKKAVEEKDLKGMERLGMGGKFGADLGTLRYLIELDEVMLGALRGKMGGEGG